MCFDVCVCVSSAAGVGAAVGLPAAAPAGPAGPAAASAQPSEARAAHDPAWTDGPTAALPHSGSVPGVARRCAEPLAPVQSAVRQSPTAPTLTVSFLTSISFWK